MAAGLVIAASQSYRPDALSILGLGPDDTFPIARAQSGFAYSAWLPGEEFLRRAYEDAIDHSRSVTGAPWYRAFLLDLAARFLAVAGVARGPIKALDFGCGYGGLLQLLACRDIECTGFEPSAARRSEASAIVVLNQTDAIAARGPFDLMICTEVLEHMADPAVALRVLRANAAPGAFLLVTVPCCTADYMDTALAGFAAGRPQPPMFNPWEHLNYFRPQDLRTLLTSEGFEVLADLGKATAARAALDGDRHPTALARAAKRLLTSPPSTQLVCRPAA